MSNVFINHYGERNQLAQLSKEAIELAHVINDFLDKKDTLEHVQEEMGDCLNLISQFEEHWGDGKLFIVVREKQKRQRERIEKDRELWDSLEIKDKALDKRFEAIDNAK